MDERHMEVSESYKNWTLNFNHLFINKTFDFTNIFSAPPGYFHECEGNKKWWVFFVSSVVCPVILYGVLGSWSLAKRLRASYSAASSVRRRAFTIIETDPASLSEDAAHAYDVIFASKRRKWRIPWGHVMEREANRIVNCQTRAGRILAVIALLIAIFSFIMYLRETSDYAPGVELCRSFWGTWEWVMDWIANMFFLVYFALRFIASSRKVWFLTEIYSIVDYATIAPSFVAISLHRNWTGFRFLRVLHIFSIPEVLQYVGVLKTRTQIRLLHLVCRLGGCVLAGSGLFHLVENFDRIRDGQHSYFIFLYYTIVTLSTVGYGDYYPVTDQGRALACIFILCALGLFASALPDIMHMFRARFKYGGGFSPEAGIQHVVVCGHVTYSIVYRFLENFFHERNETSFLCVVFISNEDPDLEMEALLRQNFSQVEYLQGDVFSTDDIRRAAVETALACMIVADKKPESTDSEDATNLLRVISIKNAYPSARVIVQLYHKKNQMHLTNLSSWNSLRGDTCISMSELKMGFLAKSCQAAGFSTIVSNLMRSYPDYHPNQSMLRRNSQEKSTMEYYVQTCNTQFFVQKLSDFYTNMDFSHAGRHCYLHLGVMMIGLFEKPTSWVAGVEFGEILINPSSVVVTPNHMGIFISDSQAAVDRAWLYCGKCHKNTTSEADVKFCGCEESGSVEILLDKASMIGNNEIFQRLSESP